MAVYNHRLSFFDIGIAFLIFHDAKGEMLKETECCTSSPEFVAQAKSCAVMSARKPF